MNIFDSIPTPFDWERRMERDIFVYNFTSVYESQKKRKQRVPSARRALIFIRLRDALSSASAVDHPHLKNDFLRSCSSADTM